MKSTCVSLQEASLFISPGLCHSVRGKHIKRGGCRNSAQKKPTQNESAVTSRPWLGVTENGSARKSGSYTVQPDSASTVFKQLHSQKWVLNNSIF